MKVVCSFLRRAPPQASMESLECKPLTIHTSTHSFSLHEALAHSSPCHSLLLGHPSMLHNPLYVQPWPLPLLRKNAHFLCFPFLSGINAPLAHSPYQASVASSTSPLSPSYAQFDVFTPSSSSPSFNGKIAPHTLRAEKIIWVASTPKQVSQTHKGIAEG